jgi:hypothetical protein
MRSSVWLHEQHRIWRPTPADPSQTKRGSRQLRGGANCQGPASTGANAGQSESRIGVRRLAWGECWTVRVQDRGQAVGLGRMLDSRSPGSGSGGRPGANAGQSESRIGVRRSAWRECWTVRVQDRGQAVGLARTLDSRSPGSSAGGRPGAKAGQSESRIGVRRLVALRARRRARRRRERSHLR